MMHAGFPDPVLDAQHTFRAVLTAMAHPGRVVEVGRALEPPAPLHPAAAAFALALVDFETPLWADRSLGADARAWLAFHTGAPLVERPAEARFALAIDVACLPPLSVFDRGTDERPERSATLVLQVEAIRAGGGRRLTGPGIEGHAALDAAGLPPTFWDDLRDNHAGFPRGVDIVLTAGLRLAALPRTTRVEG
jgi:alpha-D-ribose 1-methylphosphonate 5-triphosphate synthase subunit PhnH